MVSRLAGLALALFIATAAGGARAEGESAASAVNRAGEQRMLGQRIAKAYSQVGLNVMPAVAVAQMAAAISRFEANLEALKAASAGSPAAAKAYALLATDWLGLRQAAAAPVSRESALALARQAEAVLVAGERLTRILEEEDRSVAGKLVNLAGRQRMLSQRIAKAYMLRSWGVDSSALRDELDAAVNDFSVGLASLRARADNGAEINGELEEVGQQWEWLQAALSAEGVVSYRLIVAEAADAILEATDRITRLYELHGRR